MSKPVRELDAYYEVGGPYNVKPNEARYLYGATVDLVAPYVGQISVPRLRGLRLRTSAPAINTSTFNVPGAGEHNMLLTGRRIQGRKRVHPGGINETTQGRVTQLIKKSKIVVHTGTPGENWQLSDSLISTVHETAHTFGVIDHCEVPSCAMTKDAADYEMIIGSIAAGKPFCDDCAGDLEIAAYREMAAKL
ncbi:MAG TPA: hypothetical protein VLE73_00690 [Candidatus Saccharimonadales bacterium]|nr:hypothetical protein [Candidatus Saccharimonadales bacterium]